MNFDKLDKTKVKAVQDKVDLDTKQLEDVVNGIVTPYTERLDNYVDFIAGILKDGENPPTAQELDDFCMNLSVYLYYASAMQEQLGIKNDISNAIYKEMYNNARQVQDKGTVDDKNSLAELASQTEYLTSVCYKRAFGICKARVGAGQELLSSIKKIISRRMSEVELTHIGG